jgi:hypothetical protein
MGSTPLFDKAPAFLKETLIFPYLGGLTFVAALHRGQPWSKVDEVFRAPPESTEQVLHPEKYQSREPAVKITPAPLGSLGALKELRRDVLGELELRVLFASRVPEAVAEKAAAGWGGDRLVAYADPSGDSLPVAVLYTAWDTETDAKEAESAARKMFAAMSGKPEPAAGQPAHFTDDKHEEWTVERRTDRVLLIFGAPAGTRAALTAEIWKTWKVGK